MFGMSRTGVLAVVAATVGLAVAGCGSDSKSDAGGQATASSTAASVSPTAASADTSTTASLAVDTKEPTGIQVTDPLKSKPAAGKKVVLVECNFPTCTAWVPAYKAAAKALGWSLTVVNLDQANPDAGLQQAVNLGPDYIVVDGAPKGAMRTSLAAAKLKKIPVVITSGADKPDPGVYTQVNDGLSDGVSGAKLSQIAIQGSGGKADAVLLSIHSIPIEAALGAGVAAAFKACAGCKFDRLDFTPEQLGSGKVASLLVGYLQAHPKTDYVIFSFGDAVNGVPEALKAAGLTSRVKVLVNHNANPRVTKGMIDGSIQAQTIVNSDYLGWSAMDLLARLSVGQQPPSSAQYGLPIWLMDTPEAAKSLGSSGLWHGPTGFQKSFETLWKVGS
jgi:ribose transport system substrate-binding protein